MAVAFGLLFQTLKELLHQLVTIELFQSGSLLFRQPLKILRVVQPVHQFIGDRQLFVDPLEEVREHSVGKVPVILAIGHREVEERTVSVRRLGEKQTTTQALEAIVATLSREATAPDLL